MNLRDEVKNQAKSLGIDLFGVAPVEVYSEYLNEVKRRMDEKSLCLNDYMIDESNEKFFERLANPAKTLPSAKSIIIVGVYSYDENSDYKHCSKEIRCKTARTYAYYPVVRRLTDGLSKHIENLGYKVESGQNIPLKYVADRIGLGSYGRNGVLLTKEYGSFVALRSIITNLPMEPSSFQKTDFCTGCNVCLKACPTKALYEPYKVDPKLCLNPIGRKEDHISIEMRKKMNNWLRGCDICQDVCPVNRQLTPRDIHPLAGFDPEHHESHTDLGGLEKCPEALELIKNTYPATVRRNAVISLANRSKNREKITKEIERNMVDMDKELKEYFSWAIKELK